jgi:hypothetical protein
MLNPHDRSLLLETLRPPAGYKLDHAFGTSFSLDLYALLTAPLAFTFFTWENDKGDIVSDPLALLESLRRNAKRISIFCQSGQIAVPRKGDRLFAYLEGSVHEVAVPAASGVFHPKVWLLRYTGDTGPVYYRFVCLSRNLTFDRSWDTVLSLDGYLSDRQYAYGESNPLGDFFKSLSDITISPLNQETLNKLDQMQYEVRRVKFETPVGVEEVSFHPIGIPGYKNFHFEPEKRRMLIMAPFLTESFVSRLVEKRQDCVLVSIPESLESLEDDCLDLFDRVCSLSREAEYEEDDSDESDVDDSCLSGLHAKLFVMDDGWQANIWTGSANATEAAFRNNIEFLVRLRGKRVELGIDKLLAQVKGETNFADLLQDFKKDENREEPDPLNFELEKMAESIKRLIASSSFITEIVPDSKSQDYVMVVKHELSELPTSAKAVKITCWPVTLPPSRAVNLNPEEKKPLNFGKITLDAITAFIAFEVEIRDQGMTETLSFVSKTALVGVPDNRLQKLLRSLLKNKKEVLRLLLLLLADQSMSIHGLLEMHRNGAGSGTSYSGDLAVPLLESLLKALAQEPKKLDRVERLISDLSKTEEGAGLLPEGFMEVWEPLWQTRKRLLK